MAKIESIHADLVYPIQSVLGEGSLWDEMNKILLWVDILDYKIYSFDPGNGSNKGYDVGEDVGTVVIAESGNWVYAGKSGIHFFNPKTGEIKGPKPEMNNPGIRFNDGKCDPRGTFWAGTMAYDTTKGAGTLYEFDAKGKVIIKIPYTTISNGLAWNGSSTKFYFIDSPTYEIQEYNYNVVTGGIFGKRVVASLDKAMGLPDGMTIDNDDHLWVALFDGGKVVRINPETGDIVYEVLLPVPKVTSCAFGGTDLNELYITSASYLMEKEGLERYPLSGSLFKAKVPFTGVLPNRMKGC